MKCRWLKMNTASTGSSENTAPAATRRQSMEKVFASRLTPSGSVKRAGSSVMMSGHRKSPHTATKLNTAKVAREGLTRGSITCHQMRSRLTPSTNATSSSAPGTDRKAWRMKNTPKAVQA